MDMATKKGKGKGKVAGLFSLPQEVRKAMRSIRVSNAVFGEQAAKDGIGMAGPSAEAELASAALRKLVVSETMCCSTCGGTQFADKDAQREHYKLDWHRFNLKQALAGKAAFTEEAFEQMLEGGGGDDLSLSGSEEDDDEEEEGANDEQEAGEVWSEGLRRSRHPWFFFEDERGELMSVQKCVVDKKRERFEDDQGDAELLLSLQSLLKEKNVRWAVFLLGGGHFAGAVFDNGKPILHKTFHCYTIRAKQGGSQSSKDNKSGGSHPKSAGASLRRYNEASLIQHVRDLVSSWTEQLKTCHRIFFRAPGGSRAVLFGGKDPLLDRSDPRLRSIPFPTKRATFHEVNRVQEVLAAVQFHGSAAEYAEEMRRQKEAKESSKALKEGGGKASPKKRGQQIRRSKSREAVERRLPEEVQHLIGYSPEDSDSAEEDIMALDSFVSTTSHLAEYGNSPLPRKGKQKKNAKRSQPAVVEDSSNELKSRLVTACKSGNEKDLAKIMQEVQDEEGEGALGELLNKQHGNSKLSPLHLAAGGGHRAVVKLLLRNRADPCLRDRSKKVAYQLCPDKETRNAFRSFRAEFAEMHDWSQAQVPPPATEEAEARQREKRARQRQARKEKAKAKKEEEVERKKEEAEKERYLGLSDREKRALAAERRILAARDAAAAEKSKESEGSGGAVLSRCYQCAKDITGKVPFEYSTFVFCAMKCLKEHRQKTKGSAA